MNSLKQIHTEADFQSLLQKGTFLLLKHSLTCPISKAAYEEYAEFMQTHADLEGALLIIQESRPLSAYVAEQTHVKHESPQAILFNKGNVTWHASHWKITKATIAAALEENAKQ